MVVTYLDGGDCAVYKGRSYRLDKRTGYYLAAKKGADGRRKRLHVAVYEGEVGPLAEGMCVHHVDGDKRDNEPQNLVAMSASDHSKLHGAAMSDERREAARRSLAEVARPKASEWHRSGAGRAWHRAHAKEAYATRGKQAYACTHCGRAFETRHVYAETANRFCSNACKSAHRRAMGYDNIERSCERCGTPFETNKYSARRFCDECGRRRG